MKSSLRQIAKICLLAVAGLLALVALGLGMAWSKRDLVQAKLEKALGIPHVEIASLHLDRSAGVLQIEVAGLDLPGIAQAQATVDVNMKALLGERRLELRGLTLRNAKIDLERLLATTPAGATADQSASPAHALSDPAALLQRMGRIRLEDLAIDLDALGVHQQVLIQQAELSADQGAGPAHFSASGSASHGGTWDLSAALDVRGLAKGALQIEDLRLAATKVHLPLFYFRYLEPVAALPNEDADVLLNSVQIAGALQVSGGDFRLALNEIALETDAVSGQVHVAVVKEAAHVKYAVTAKVASANAQVLRLLPPALIGSEVSAWLKANLKAAAVRNASLDLAGDEQDLKRFALHLPIKDARLSFAPGWPEVAVPDLDLAIGADSLKAEGQNAQLATLPALTATTVVIDVPRFSHDPVLNISIKVPTEIASALKALAATPARERLKSLYELPVELSGTALATIDIAVPLAGGAASAPDVRGTIALTDAVVRPLDVRFLPVGGLNGAVTFASDTVQVDLKASPESKDLLRAFGVAAGDFVDGVLPTTVHAKLVTRPKDLTLSADLSADLSAVRLAVPGVLQKDAGKAETLHAHLDGNKTGQLVSVSTSNLRAQVKIDESGEALRFGAALASLDHGQRAVRLDEVRVDTTDIAGTVRWQDGVSGSLDLIFSKLHLKNLATAKTSAQPSQGPVAAAKSAPIDPRTLPAVHFYCSDLRLDQRHFGEVLLASSKRADGLSIDRLTVELGPASAYDTSGTWTATPFGTEAKLGGKMHLRDGGEALTSLGFGESVQGLRGDLSFALTWPDLSSDLLFQAATVHVHADLEDGVLPAVDNEALKILDVLTLHILDLDNEGLEIERAKLNFTCEKGQIQVSDTRIDGTSATFDLDGRVNLADSGIDGAIGVSLKISRTINAAALGLVNPLLAIGYLSQGDDLEVVHLDKYTKHRYHVAGTLEDPKVSLLGVPLTH